MNLYDPSTDCSAGGRYVRFRSTTPNTRGVRVGVFALANGLARSGALTPEQYQQWRLTNDWFEAAYPDPSTIDPGVYDAALNPGAVSWFKHTATELIDRTTAHTRLLDAHGVPWERVESDDPGRIIFEDDVHVVVSARPRSAARSP